LGATTKPRDQQDSAAKKLAKVSTAAGDKTKEPESAVNAATLVDKDASRTVVHMSAAVLEACKQSAGIKRNLASPTAAI
jgi:hypothetical protein